MLLVSGMICIVQTLNMAKDDSHNAGRAVSPRMDQTNPDEVLTGVARQIIYEIRRRERATKP